MAEIYYPHNYYIGTEIVYLLRGLNDQLKNLPENPQDKFLDMDLTGDISRYLTDEARLRVSRPMGSLRSTGGRLFWLRKGLDTEAEDGGFLLARIRSVEGYIRALEQSGDGKRIEARTFLERTLGLSAESSLLRPVPQAEIDQVWQDVVGLVSNNSGKDITRTDRDVWPLIAGPKVHPASLDRLFHELKEKKAPIETAVFGGSITPSWGFEIKKGGKLWTLWTDYDKYGFQITANESEDKRDRIRQGSIESFYEHEVLEHAGRAAIISENIRLGRINPGYGAFCIPGPEQPTLEGLANTLIFYIPELFESRSPYGQSHGIYRYYESLVERNAHLFANGLAPFEGDPVEYLMDNLPTMTVEDARIYVEKVTTNPCDMAYQLAYGATHEFRAIAASLEPKPKGSRLSRIVGGGFTPDRRADFVRESFNQLRTLEQSQQLAHRLEDPKYPVEPRRGFGLDPRFLLPSAGLFLSMAGIQTRRA